MIQEQINGFGADRRWHRAKILDPVMADLSLMTQTRLKRRIKDIKSAH